MANKVESNGINKSILHVCNNIVARMAHIDNAIMATVWFALWNIAKISLAKNSAYMNQHGVDIGTSPLLS